VGAICAPAECPIDLEELGEFVAARFPDLPAIELYRLAELPRTRAGKLDAQALITSHASLAAEARDGDGLRSV
jgi:hypothetical protein